MINEKELNELKSKAEELENTEITEENTQSLIYGAESLFISIEKQLEGLVKLLKEEE
jgi:hypothetical protein